MVKRIMFIILGLAMLIGMGLTTTAAIAGKQAPAKAITINQVEGVEFLDEGWVDPATKFEDEFAVVINKAKRDEGRIPDKFEEALLRSQCLNSKRWAFQIHLSKEEALFSDFKLGIKIPDDVKLQFNGVGCLSFELEMPDGRIVTVKDLRILCPYQYNPIYEWANTGTGPVTYTSDKFSQGLPDPRVHVILPRWVMGAKVLKVQPTSNMQIIYPNRTAMFE